MWKSIAGWASNQVRLERENMNDLDALPFSELLPASRVEQALEAENVNVRERGTYTPLVTLWTFLSQVASPDHSCREAVARLRAFHTADGQTPCSPETGPYCKARQRLPENICARLVRDTGGELHNRVKNPSLLAGRPVKLVDGSTVSMPDTPANQAEYQSGRVSATEFAKTGTRIPVGADRRIAVVGLRGGARLGDQPLHGEGDWGNGLVSPALAISVCR
jgi:hypothetical protein